MTLIGGDDVAANARAERASNTDALGVAETPHPPLNAPPQPAGSLHTLCFAAPLSIPLFVRGTMQPDQIMLVGAGAITLGWYAVLHWAGLF
jgi:hypothetical protein